MCVRERGAGCVCMRVSVCAREREEENYSVCMGMCEVTD